jgi:hypothetical protein
MRRENVAIIVVFAAILIILGSAVLFFVPQLTQKTTVHIGDDVLQAQVASTDSQRKTGLGGQTGLAADGGMLFVFQSDAKWGIWMKDMNFHIDVVWLNSGKQVVDIVKNISPDTYPQVFTPELPARYVIELPADTVDSKNIHDGTLATW